MTDKPITAEQVAEAAAEYAVAVTNKTKSHPQKLTHMKALALRWRVQQRARSEAA